MQWKGNFPLLWGRDVDRKSMTSVVDCADPLLPQTPFFHRPGARPALPTADAGGRSQTPSHTGTAVSLWWVVMTCNLPLVPPQLRPWSTFGTLEVSAQFQLEPREFSVVTEEDCEILKIPAKDYAKIKLVWPDLIYILLQHRCKIKLRFACLDRICPYLFYF